MDLELTESQRGARDTARHFAREKLDRLGIEVDRTHEFPHKAVAELGRLGMLGVFIPEQYGGVGLDNVAYALVVEELSVECASTGVIVSVHGQSSGWATKPNAGSICPKWRLENGLDVLR
jgi:alkylation response protein AidB-like acyl-CoA dehydrogenase